MEGGREGGREGGCVLCFCRRRKERRREGRSVDEMHTKEKRREEWF